MNHNVLQDNTLENNAKQSPWTLLGILVNALAFAYVIAVYTLANAEGWSRTCFTLAVVFFVVTVADVLLSRGTLPRLLALPWAFCLFVVVSVSWARDGETAISVAASTFSAILGGTSVWLALANRLSWKTLAWAAVTGSIILVVSSRGEIDLSRITSVRVGGLAGANSIPYLLFFAAFLVWCAPVKLPWWLSWLVWGFAAFAVSFTGSRKSLIFLGIAILIFVIHLAPKLKSLTTWLMFAAGGVLIVVSIGIGLVNVRNLNVEESVQSIGTVHRLEDLLSGHRENIRIPMMKDAIDLWLRSPLIGNGAGQFGVLSQYGTYSHNNYTELLANYGIVGFMLYYSLFVVLLARVLPGVPQLRSEQLGILMLILMILILDMGAVAYPAKSIWVFLAAIVHLTNMTRLQAVVRCFPTPQGVVRGHA